MPRQGLLVLDNSAYSRIVDPSAMERLRANMRAAWLEPAATEVNLVEAAATSRASDEAQLIETIKEFAGRKPLLLDWPLALLRRISQGLLDGEMCVRTGETGKEWYLNDVDARRALRDESYRFTKNLDDAFQGLHNKARPATQKWLKAHSIKRHIDDLHFFLDEEWPAMDLRAYVAELTWSALGLPGEAPISRLLNTPSWRILLDAEGAALYARAIVHQQPKAVQRSDLLQLIYLGASGMRLFATADGPFLDLARQIINHRHANAQVVHIQEMLT